jgi:hypothetical protein
MRGIGGAGDVAGEAVAPERDEEELPPLCEVGFLQIKGDRDMAFDGGDIGGGIGARVWGVGGVGGLA